MTSRQKTLIATALEKDGKPWATVVAAARHPSSALGGGPGKPLLFSGLGFLICPMAAGTSTCDVRDALHSGCRHYCVTCWGGDAGSMHLEVSLSASPQARNSSWVSGQET